MKKRNLFARAVKLIDAAKRSTKNREAGYRLEEIEVHTDAENPYAEPGYSAKHKAVALGNWNDIWGWNAEKNTRDYVDNTLTRLGNALERIGVELEWSDEWVTCYQCQKIVRCSGDSYGWKQAYWDSDGGAYCHECVKSNPAAYLEDLEGNATACETIGIDLEKRGYRLLEDRFENGWYGGQDADPKVIAASLIKMGVTRFIFRLDDVRQFDIRFSVYVHKSQIKKVKNWSDAKKKAALDPAEGLRRGLSAAKILPLQGSQPDGSVAVTKVDSSTGTATTKLVSRQDFIDGKALD